MRIAHLAVGAAAASMMIGLSTTIAVSLTQSRQAPVAIDKDDIGGIVAGPKGPEAGVWVIAETRDLPVRYIKIVVTDDQGRYVVPDLPPAKYSLWARGYGLADSVKSTAQPGQWVNITPRPASSPAEAAQSYPAIYWYSMLKIPAEGEFGTNAGIASGVTPTRWIDAMKSNGCVGCHQLGQLSTRTIPEAFQRVESTVQAWQRRVQAGQSGAMMSGALNGIGPLSYQLLAEWTDRIAKGELPQTTPERPQGVERNIVVTLRDWMTEKHYLHDLIASDRRNPTVNAYGPLYGSPEYSSDLIPILDPVKNVATTFKAPVRDADMPLSLGPGHAAALDPTQPSAYWGGERIWETRVNNHNSMFDGQGRVWLAAAVRGPENPAFCRAGSEHPSAKLFPIERTNRHLAVFHPKTQKYTFVDTCFGTHHLQFGYDKDNTIWTSGGGPVVGWLNTRVFDETGDAARAQGWTAAVLDSNGNGRRDAYTEPGQPADPAKDRRINAGFYAVMPSPADGSVWGSFRGQVSGVIRIAPGANPPETALAEVYNVPLPGFGVRGADIDSKGVVWVSLASGHMGSFDRRKCKGPLNGPAATGDHCREGWSFYKYPGPGFEGIGDNSAESSYYSWVDQHNTFGLGADVPMSTGNLNDGLIALKDGKMIVLRVPYPLGFYSKGFDGRIDDPKAGWKGRGLWAANGDRAPWLIEGGKGNRPLAAHFQLRPDPLAR
jgi:hypothetical protein